MAYKSHPFGCLILLALVAAFVPVQSAQALTAEQYFADGNRLFREDLYWAALLRYRQAGEEGLNTPLLHYNMGIAHYRAGQHIRARDSLLKALDDPTIRVAAHYNLGLNAHALGDTDEALRWFRLARDQDQDEKLQAFAVVAISRIREQRATPDEFEIRAEEREKKRDFSELMLRAHVGYGTDDNVFRSPDRPYIDLSDRRRPVIIPDVKSGAFVPVSLSAKYRINSLEHEGFFVAYRLAGRYYTDKELENGNEYLHEASFGSDYRRKEGARERSVNSAFKVAHHDETYYDPDDGGSRNVDGVDIDDRMNYLRALRSVQNSRPSCGTTRSRKSLRSMTTSIFSRASTVSTSSPSLRCCGSRLRDIAAATVTALDSILMAASAPAIPPFVTTITRWS